jgi:hypothetical protein
VKRGHEDATAAAPPPPNRSACSEPVPETNISSLPVSWGCAIASGLQDARVSIDASMHRACYMVMSWFVRRCCKRAFYRLGSGLQSWGRRDDGRLPDQHFRTLNASIRGADQRGQPPESA